MPCRSLSLWATGTVGRLGQRQGRYSPDYSRREGRGQLLGGTSAAPQEGPCCSCSSEAALTAPPSSLAPGHPHTGTEIASF